MTAGEAVAGAGGALPRSRLVLGGARSGKSAWAEAQIEAAGGGIYLATGQAFDDEMAARLAAHRARRGALWETVEAPLELLAALDVAAARGRPILVDCLTLWVSNLMFAERDCAAAGAALAAWITAAPVPICCVSNEVGMGIVPDNALARAFRDEAGRLHQRLAAVCAEVALVVAGLPLWVKRGV